MVISLIPLPYPLQGPRRTPISGRRPRKTFPRTEEILKTQTQAPKLKKYPSWSRRIARNYIAFDVSLPGEIDRAIQLEERTRTRTQREQMEGVGVSGIHRCLLKKKESSSVCFRNGWFSGSPDRNRPTLIGRTPFAVSRRLPKRSAAPYSISRHPCPPRLPGSKSP